MKRNLTMVFCVLFLAGTVFSQTNSGSGKYHRVTLSIDSHSREIILEELGVNLQSECSDFTDDIDNALYGRMFSYRDIPNGDEGYIVLKHNKEQSLWCPPNLAVKYKSNKPTINISWGVLLDKNGEIYKVDGVMLMVIIPKDSSVDYTPEIYEFGMRKELWCIDGYVLQ